MRKIGTALLTLALAGCAGTNFSYEKASHVQVGMTEGEVVKIMGRPYQVISMPDSERWIWSHANGLTGSAKAMSMEFRDGRVSAVPKIPSSFVSGSAQNQQLAKPEWTNADSSAAKPQPAPPAAAPSKAQYQQQQLDQLMQQNLPYEEYMKRYKAIMGGSN